MCFAAGGVFGQLREHQVVQPRGALHHVGKQAGVLQEFLHRLREVAELRVQPGLHDIGRAGVEH